MFFAALRWKRLKSASSTNDTAQHDGILRKPVPVSGGLDFPNNQDMCRQRLGSGWRNRRAWTASACQCARRALSRRPTRTITSNRTPPMGRPPSPPRAWRAWQTLLRRISQCPGILCYLSSARTLRSGGSTFAKRYVGLACQERQDFPLAPSVVAPRPGSLALLSAHLKPTALPATLPFSLF